MASFNRYKNIVIAILVAVLFALHVWRNLLLTHPCTDSTLATQQTLFSVTVKAGSHSVPAATPAIPSKAAKNLTAAPTFTAASSRAGTDLGIKIVKAPGKAIPWRPMGSIAKQDGRSPWLVPILVTSAFWVPEGHVKLVVAYDKAYTKGGSLQCCFKNPSLDVIVARTSFEMPPSSLSESSFMYAAGYASCSISGLQIPTAGQLEVLIIGNNDPDPVIHAHDVSWVPVEVVHELSVQQVTEYSSGKGPMAACTAPLHEDGYASSMVEWTEFQRLVGIEKVFVYDFNSGPMLKPQLDYYANQGFFEVFEWIIPTSIMRDPHQECLLPFFAPSANRVSYGAANCSMHQDNYQIAWWGQPLALMDCMLRARSHYRWVVVLDFDEYLVPKQTRTLGQLLQQVHNTTGACKTQFTFMGRVVCSGCQHQYHSVPAVHAAASAPPNLPIEEGPHGDLEAVCLQPTVGFHHILWSSVTADMTDHEKSVVDPRAVTLPGIHTSTAGSYRNCGGTVKLTPAQGLKLLDRAHDIHIKDTFMAKMLPLLWQFVHDRHVMPLSHSLHLAPISSQGCAAHKACRGGAPKKVDFTMCNAHGAQLSASINRALADMVEEAVFDSWLHLPVSAANVYGGHEFNGWGPPKGTNPVQH